MTQDSPIEPTIGRIVLYRTSQAMMIGMADERPAIVTKVHTRNMIDLEVFGCGGLQLTSVGYQDGEPRDGKAGWRWMPYQVQQAAKA